MGLQVVQQGQWTSPSLSSWRHSSVEASPRPSPASASAASPCHWQLPPQGPAVATAAGGNASGARSLQSLELAAAGISSPVTRRAASPGSTYSDSGEGPAATAAVEAAAVPGPAGVRLAPHQGPGAQASPAPAAAAMAAAGVAASSIDAAPQPAGASPGGQAMVWDIPASDAAWVAPRAGRAAAAVQPPAGARGCRITAASMAHKPGPPPQAAPPPPPPASCSGLACLLSQPASNSVPPPGRPAQQLPAPASGDRRRQAFAVGVAALASKRCVVSPEQRAAARQLEIDQAVAAQQAAAEHQRQQQLQLQRHHQQEQELRVLPAAQPAELRDAPARAAPTDMRLPGGASKAAAGPAPAGAPPASSGGRAARFAAPTAASAAKEKGRPSPQAPPVAGAARAPARRAATVRPQQGGRSRATPSPRAARAPTPEAAGAGAGKWRC